MWFFIFVTYLVSPAVAPAMSPPIAIAGQAPLVVSLPYSSFSSFSWTGGHWHTARSIDRYGWNTGSRTNAAGQYLQVDFGSEYKIRSVSTWPRKDNGWYVKTYKLKYSIDGVTFSDYGKTLNGNTASDPLQEVNNVLDPGFTARYLRFIPEAYSVAKAMRVEAYTDAIAKCCNTKNFIGGKQCVRECFYEAHEVAEWPLVVSLPYSSFSSSSEDNHYFHTARSIDRNGWYTTNQGADEYLQVDFGSEYEITSVSTWTRKDAPSQYVKTYKLKYSIDGITFSDYGKTLNGNTAADALQEINNVLDPGFSARYLRFIPEDYSGFKTMRVEAYTDDVKCIYNEAVQNSQLFMPPYSLNHLLYVATGIILCMLLIIIFLCWSLRNKGVHAYAKTKQNEAIEEL